MVNHTYCRGWQDPARAQAQATAQAIIAQGRQAARERQQNRSPSPEEEPMNRYIHIIPRPAAQADGQPASAAMNPELQSTLERILETLKSQNQRLIDLLGAVNALTAAVLSIQARQEGGG